MSYLVGNEPRCEKTGFSGFPTRSDTNRAVQPQKMARGLKFRVSEVRRLYYQCSENKGADQLRGYRMADLCLCFRICKKTVFSRHGSNDDNRKIHEQHPINKLSLFMSGKTCHWDFHSG